MFGQLNLTFEQVIRITPNAQVVYYQSGSTFTTTKKKLVEGCGLDDKQLFIARQFPEGQIKLKTIVMGVFELAIS